MSSIKNFEVTNMSYIKENELGYLVTTEGNPRKFNVPKNLPDECVFMYAGKELVMNYNMPDESAEELQTYRYTEEQIDNKIAKLKATILNSVSDSVKVNTNGMKPEVRNDDAIIANYKS